ncbi:transporter substrate-binding domain-containing protein [Nakamurella aerolata]|uniref:ABC transporter substrate-binding protein n=1 Tax=Nakamurella aerolata TaxID=1656892 RepID=A0A849AC20_9ACTN|nr:ABC transporter substrate-binding protein [Nakamurella aerolata]
MSGSAKTFRSRRSLLRWAAVSVVGFFGLTACATPDDAAPTVRVAAQPAAAGQSAGPGETGASSAGVNLSPQQNRITTPKVDSIAALVPADIRKRGTLVVTGSAGSAPPLRFYADDDKTVIGAETDLAYLFADVLGLKVELRAADWAQNFVQIDSGKADAFISNVTVTEQRKQKYDFATYRKDDVAFEVGKNVSGAITRPKDAAGLKIAVSSGTNQEQLLLDWNKQNQAAGLQPIEISYYQNATDYYLALGSGRIDAYLGPNPSAAYHVAVTGQTRIAGVVSGAGDALQGEIAVLTKKGNGLAPAYAAAINETIANGSYAKVLGRWNLSSEAVSRSAVNPPGLPAEG